MHCKSKSLATVEESNKYIPPRREESFSHNESTCIRVTGLSQQITQQDFTTRFMRFGKITRAFLPRDYVTGELRGYGYVTFLKRQEAQRAMEMMDGRGYDNLIMHIAWDERPPPPTTFRKKSKI
jgi:RNA recognition motif-containing protein